MDTQSILFQLVRQPFRGFFATFVTIERQDHRFYL